MHLLCPRKLLIASTPFNQSGFCIVRRYLLGLSVLLVLALSASAATPHLLYVQGKVTNKATGLVVSGLTVNMTVWTAASGGLEVSGYEGGETTTTSANGTFDILLGSTKTLNLLYNQQYYIQMTAGGEIVDLAPTNGATNRSSLIASGGPANATELPYSGSTTVADQLSALSPDAGLLFLAHYNDDLLSAENQLTNASGAINYETGKFGDGVLLDNATGTDDLLVYPGDGNINLTQGSVSLWFKPKPAYYGSPFAHLFRHTTNGSMSNNNSIAITEYAATGRLYVIWGDNSANVQTMVGAINLTANAFNHIVLTWNGGTAALYVNGQLDNSTVFTTLPTQTGNLYVGSIPDQTLHRPANGVFDEVAVYNRPLSASEVGVLYRSQSQAASGLIQSSSPLVFVTNSVGSSAPAPTAPATLDVITYPFTLPFAANIILLNTGSILRDYNPPAPTWATCYVFWQLDSGAIEGYASMEIPGLDSSQQWHPYAQTGVLSNVAAGAHTVRIKVQHGADGGNGVCRDYNSRLQLVAWPV